MLFVLKGVEEEFAEFNERESSPEYQYYELQRSDERRSSPETGIEYSEDYESYQSHERVQRECMDGELEKNHMETNDEKLPDELDEVKLPNCIEKWKVPGVVGHRVRCKVCYRFKNIVLRMTRGGPPNITTIPENDIRQPPKIQIP